MCGVFGIVGTEDISSQLANGLQFLTHRGPEAVGFLTLDDLVDGRFHLLKEEGLAMYVSRNSKYQKIQGPVGIGHTRYTTMGEGGAKNAQPTVSRTLGIGLAHNGHVINSDQIQTALEDKGVFFQTDNDGERILNLFSYYYFNESSPDKKKNIFFAIEKVMQQVQGSYSAVAIIKGQGLVAFRDPHGIRPLLSGTKEYQGQKAAAFASESIALTQNFFEVKGDVERGNAIFVDKNLEWHQKEIMKKERKFCPFEYIYFADAFSHLEGRRVNTVRGNAGKLLVKDNPGWQGKFDIVQAVPYSAIPAAQEIAMALGVYAKEGMYKYRYGGRIFMSPHQEDRELEAASNFLYFLELFEGKKVLLVDDSIVRGTNSKSIISMIKSVAKETHFASTFPEIIGSCFYGIDTPTIEELIAPGMSNEEIRQDIGSPDSLVYQKKERIPEAIGCKSCEICTGCYTLDYPTSIKPEKVSL